METASTMLVPTILNAVKILKNVKNVLGTQIKYLLFKKQVWLLCINCVVYEL